MKLHTHGGDLSKAADRYGLPAGSFLDFSASINPLGMPAGVRRALADNLPALTHYPDPACLQPRRALASRLGIDPDHVIMGNGAAELIYLAARTLRPRRSLVLAPSFVQYAHALVAEGSEVGYVYLKPPFAVPFDQLRQRLSEVDLLLMGNPNNPTGRSMSRGDLLELLQIAARQGTTVIIDEAFLDFLKDGPERTMAGEAPRWDNLLVLGSLTKFYALPGLRVGYGVGSLRLLERLAARRDPWGVNALAQAVVAPALADEAYRRRTLRLVAREGRFLYRELGRLPGIRPHPTEANFILCEISCDHVRLTAACLRDRLGRQGILIRDCADFPGLSPYYLRVAVRTRPENERLLGALREASTPLPDHFATN